ncbi:MAG: ureidoglycolate lyase [Geitlerinemataceae cyanobacterium]
MSVLNSIQSLHAEQIAPESFRAYGQAIFPSEDGKLFDETDARLQLANGIPRFYIMRLTQKGRDFHRMTRHIRCTQCLGSLEGKDWLMAVAPPSQSDRPDISQLRAFRIPGNCFIKLEVGTWHAGPYFDWEFVDFYNLELSDTNVTDHFTYNFLKNDKISFEITLDKSR